MACWALIFGCEVFAQAERVIPFTVRLRLNVTEEAGWFDTASLILQSSKSTAQKITLEISRRRLRLKHTADGEEEPIWRQRTALTPGKHDLILKQRPDRFAICLDDVEIGEVDVQLPGRVRCSFAPGDGLTAAEPPRVQRVGAIAYADDFARANEGHDLWETISGRFALNTSLNPGSSQSAFQMWGSKPQGEGLTIATNSHWFWDDYQIGVSAQCDALPGTWGIVFHYLSPERLHLLRWSQPRAGEGRIELVRRRPEGDTVIAQAPMVLQAGQWYRATVVTHDGKVRAFVGGSEVLQVSDPHLIGGRVGLYLADTRSAYFDDVVVASTDPSVNRETWRVSDPFGPSEKTWSDFSDKHFVDDKFMVQWAHPKSLWEPGKGGMSWFRSRLFHDVRFSWKNEKHVSCHWPGRAVRLVLFGDPAGGVDGYAVTIKRDAVLLERSGVRVLETPWQSETLQAVTAEATAGHLRCWIDEQLVLDWQDPNPIQTGHVGADIGRTFTGSLRRSDWRNAAKVESSHRLDYGFDCAPTVWQAQSGNWRGTHRWACVPKWSFFGGRGNAGGPGTDHANATLWNLRRFTGDFDLEVSFAPMEGTPQRVHFGYPVTLNLAFAADGRRLDSGYMLLFGTYDIPTRLFAEGQEIATFTKRVKPDLRNDPMPWYRHVTRVWQQVRIQRRKGRILVDAARHNDSAAWLGFERLFDIPDTAELNGDRFGFWTWGPNGMALSRATMSFEKSPGTADPAPTAHSPEAPGVRKDIRTGEEGHPQIFIRTANLDSGGPFCHEMESELMDAAKLGEIEFAFRPGPGAALSVLAEVRGQTAEFGLTAPLPYRPHRVIVGSVISKPETWNRVRFDLGSALREAFPDGPLLVERLCIGSPYASVAEIAGLGKNSYGTWFDIAEFEWSPRTLPREDNRVPQLQLWLAQTPLVDDFENSLGEWSCLGGWDGAFPSRDTHQPRSGKASLRLLNRRMAGPAGAWMRSAAFDAAALPRLAFDYRFPKGVELDLVGQANGQWFEVVLIGNDNSWPIIGRVRGFKADGTWRHVDFDLYSALRRRLRTDTIRVDSLGLADTNRMTTWQNHAYWLDNVCFVPAVPAKGQRALRLTTHPPAEIAGFSCIVDEKAETDPGCERHGEGAELKLTPEMAGKTLHVRGQCVDGTWTPALHLPLAGATAPRAGRESARSAQPKRPLPAPFVSYISSRRLCRNEFEWSRSPDFPEREFGNASIRREAWMLRCESDGAIGQGCVELVNLSPNGFCSGYLHRNGWDVDDWPMVAFDYKFEQPGCALNLSMLVNEAMTIVEWTGANRPGGYFHDEVIGSAEQAEQDGKWHHVQFNLLEMLLKKRFPDARSRGKLSVSELATWATSHSGRGTYMNPTGARVKLDNVTVYSPRDPNPGFEWDVHGIVKDRLAGYSYAFDKDPDTVPGESVQTKDNRVEFSGVMPGVWYFHVRACNQTGEWGKAGHTRVELAP